MVMIMILNFRIVNFFWARWDFWNSGKNGDVLLRMYITGSVFEIENCKNEIYVIV